MIKPEDISIELERALFDMWYANIQENMEDCVKRYGYMPDYQNTNLETLASMPVRMMHRFLTQYDLMTPTIELELFPYLFAENHNDYT